VLTGILLLLISLGSTALMAPDCAYSGYGCTYLVWYNGDGTGDVLASCDQGATHFWYSGHVGTCPGMDL
jgi:hypothetical protein